MVLKHWSLSPDIFYQLEYALQYAGPFFFICLQISTLQTVYKIWKDQSTGIFSGFPFISLFVSSLIWSLYGILLPDITLAWPNLFGVISGFIGCVSFHVVSLIDDT
jgi:uncharacterized protein with PQ loop repeat